jgi:uncharacterized protein YdiU (UPF0061 family)
VEWNLQKLSEAFIPFLDESQLIQVATQLQNFGHSAKAKQRQARANALGSAPPPPPDLNNCNFLGIKPFLNGIFLSGDHCII